MNNNEVATAAIRYPVQAFKVKRTTKTLGVDAHLFAPQDDDLSSSPLELHNGFSRFVFTIVDKSNPSSVITPKANIPCRDIDCIKLKTEIAMQEYFSGGTIASTGTIQDNDEHVLKTGPAFTQKLLDNNFRGKTPAEVLIADPNAKEGLLRTKQWLQQNLSQYPKNASQIQAIDDAIMLFDMGELQDVTTDKQPATSSVLEIYKTEYKHLKQTNEQGNSLVYSIQVVFDKSKDYPFTIEITNCFAPIEVLPTGQHRPIMKKATHMAKSSMALSDNEWVGLISHIARVKEYFELTMFRPLFTKAMALAYPNKQ